MNHILYIDGDFNDISWVIQTDESIISQKRKHTKIYKNKITKIQSKYVALHIALFWGIGTFIIKNMDEIKIKLDEEIMFEQLKINPIIQDEFIKNRIQFINNFIKQRKLKIEFQIIDSKDNIAKKY
ncbi:MAG: hypothetical protein NZ747_00395 [Nitrosopumilus sp.]|nr:hypothetical protein [Nitrosopumilus sp.]